MRANGFCKDRDWLYQKYVVEMLTGDEIAMIAGCSFQTVYDWLHKHGISVQRTGPRIEAEEELYRDPTWLYEQYWEQGKTATEIGDEFGYNEAVIRRWLLETSVGTRPRGHRTDYTLSGEQSVWDAPAWLYKQYWDKKKPMCQIAEEVGVSWSVIQWRFEKYRIPTRTVSERHLGKTNPNWRGGKSFIPYPITWNEPFRRAIRERDDYVCAICGHPEAMCVHHIDYDKNNTMAANCITLCRACHSMTNGKRELWQSWLEKMVVERAVVR